MFSIFNRPKEAVLSFFGRGTSSSDYKYFDKNLNQYVYVIGGFTVKQFCEELILIKNEMRGQLSKLSDLPLEKDTMNFVIQLIEKLSNLFDTRKRSLIIHIALHKIYSNEVTNLINSYLEDIIIYYHALNNLGGMGMFIGQPSETSEIRFVPAIFLIISIYVISGIIGQIHFDSIANIFQSLVFHLNTVYKINVSYATKYNYRSNDNDNINIFRQSYGTQRKSLQDTSSQLQNKSATSTSVNLRPSILERFMGERKSNFETPKKTSLSQSQNETPKTKPLPEHLRPSRGFAKSQTTSNQSKTTAQPCSQKRDSRASYKSNDMNRSFYE